jgi:hypothetical protein
VNAGAFDRLAQRIKDFCDFDLNHKRQTFYLLAWRGEWLIATYPHRGSRLIGVFDDGITPSQLKHAVYAALDKARPG